MMRTIENSTSLTYVASTSQLLPANPSSQGSSLPMRSTVQSHTCGLQSHIHAGAYEYACACM